MARALLLACSLAMPATCSAARVETKAAEEFPWRKAAIVSAVLGNTLGHNVALAEASERRANPQGDPYDRVQSLLLDIFCGDSPPDEGSFRKLTESLRAGMDDEGARMLASKLSTAIAAKLEVKAMTDSDGRRGIEQYTIPPSHGDHGMVIGHYPSSTRRTDQDLRELQRMLWSVQQSKETSGIFVRYFAQSHTPEELEQDPGADVFVMFELPVGTLRQVLNAFEWDFEARIRMLIQILTLINRMHNFDVAHVSDITPDTVLMIGDPEVPKSLGVLLSPKILATRSDPMTADDSFESDVRELGSLLRFLLTSDWKEEEQEFINMFLAFGKALEAGVFAGQERIVAEFHDLFRLSASEPSDGMLQGKRVHYLKLAVEAEMAADHGMREATVPAA